MNEIIAVEFILDKVEKFIVSILDLMAVSVSDRSRRSLPIFGDRQHIFESAITLYPTQQSVDDFSKETKFDMVSAMDFPVLVVATTEKVSLRLRKQKIYYML